MKEQLSKIVERAIEVAEKTGEFAIEQAPLLLQEFYMWHITKSVLWMVVSVIGVFIIYKIIITYGKLEKDGWYDNKFLGRWYDGDELVVGLFFGGSLSLILTIAFIYNMFNLLKIIIAPKIYLIEYFIN